MKIPTTASRVTAVRDFAAQSGGVQENKKLLIFCTEGRTFLYHKQINAGLLLPSSHITAFDSRLIFCNFSAQTPQIPYRYLTLEHHHR